MQNTHLVGNSFTDQLLSSELHSPEGHKHLHSDERLALMTAWYINMNKHWQPTEHPLSFSHSQCLFYPVLGYCSNMVNSKEEHLLPL